MPSRMLSLRHNVFLAQKHLPEPLMIIELELSLGRRETLGEDLRRAVFNSGNADRACAHNSHCGSNRDSNQMSDCHDRLHPADDRRNQSANGTGGKAEKLTNHVMRLTVRPRIQLEQISLGSNR